MAPMLRVVMSTTFEHFQEATLSLTKATHLKERLAEAFRDHLAYIAADELPSELREEFRTIRKEVTREPPLVRGEDALRATVRKMSSDELESIACRVVYLFAGLARAQGANMRMKAAKAAASAANFVPLYLAEA